MRIGFDARMVYQTGIGRYIRNLLRELSLCDTENEYYIYLTGNDYQSFEVPGKSWIKILAKPRWHTIAEQFIMPGLFTRYNLDLVHIPYFNVPLGYSGKYIVTMHDLTMLHFATGKATTLPMPLYFLRQIGYRTVLDRGLRNASRIIAVSQATKNEIETHYPEVADKITVTYEGIDPAFMAAVQTNPNPASMVDGPYFLYVGNAYPHKNLEMLVRSFDQSLKGYPDSLKVRLVFVGSDDFFYTRLKSYISKTAVKKRILFLTDADDKMLHAYYRNALALVIPSLMEGFGLPLIEALTSGCRVLCSDIPVFHEIGGRQVTYFNPYSVNELSGLFKSFFVPDRSKIKNSAATAHPALDAKFNWRNMALETLSVYKSI